MTNGTEYPIDVAFSFVQQDEDLAVQLMALLAGRLQTFVYTNRQDELVGRDGEEELNRVFGRDARIVVILHRGAWGTTPWTRVEETAIRNRAHEEGFDFTVFIPMERPAATPPWVPRARIWYDLDRWGPEGAAAIIERRVEESGGAVRPETATDRATRLARDLAAEEERLQFLNSDAGVREAEAEAGRLLAQLADFRGDGLDLAVDTDGNACQVYSGGFTVSVAWSNAYTNTTRHARLHVRLWNGRPDIGGKRFISDATRLRHLKYCFDRNRTRGHGWRLDTEGDFLSRQQLADLCIDLLLDQIRGDRLRDR